MHNRPHSPEFTRLATRWLDGVATQEEAARLWATILASKECAAQFAEHARFELLLEQTCVERAREIVVTGAVQKEVRKQRQRTFLKVAAIIIVLGIVLRLLWPAGDPGIVQSPPPVPAKSLENEQPANGMAMHPVRILVQPDGSSATKPETRPLSQLLDEFFLTSVSLDRVPLREAMLRLEEQLRALNFTQADVLARLRATLPAGAANTEVTFHSGAISYLKAVRAIAALADCDVQVSDTGLALNSRVSPNQRQIQSRTVETLLAVDGIGLHTDLNELLADARALGLLTGDGKSPILRGTSGQFIALAALADSRRQIRKLPDIGVLPFVYPAPVGEKGHALSEEEAKEQLRMAMEGSVEPQFLTLRPGAVAVTDIGPDGPDFLVSAIPAGPYMQITLQPNTPTANSQTPTVTPIAMQVIVPSMGGAVVPVQGIATGIISVGVAGGAVSPQRIIASNVPASSGGQLTLADTNEIRYFVTAGTTDIAPLKASSLTLNNGTINYIGVVVTNNGAIQIPNPNPNPTPTPNPDPP